MSPLLEARAEDQSREREVGNQLKTILEDYDD